MLREVAKIITPELFTIKKLIVSLGVLLSIFALGIVGPTVYPVSPTAVAGPLETPPSPTYPLGTDAYGKDILAQLMAGVRGSLQIGATAAAISLLIGVFVGLIAGYKGKIVDNLLMMLTDIVLLLPSILLMILVAAYFKWRDPLLVSIIIGVTSWPWVARAVRSQTLSLKNREFVNLSKMAGLSDLQIVIRDVLPNIASYIFMAYVLLMSGAMIAETGLSMIGLGTTQGVTLGNILFWAQVLEAVRRGLWWWFIPPGAMLVALAASLLMLATALDEYFNPKLRGS
ncbi:MAG: ABC transporter permease [Nitrososphaerota archaeon]|nr:ABC transporter permease [Candidatus Calditenuaceae archaeon]MDW8073423.1 ABC transporter permease [Nitrososphaerota archaeon]